MSAHARIDRLMRIMDAKIALDMIPRAQAMYDHALMQKLKEAHARLQALLQAPDQLPEGRELVGRPPRAR